MAKVDIKANRQENTTGKGLPLFDSANVVNWSKAENVVEEQKTQSS